MGGPANVVGVGVSELGGTELVSIESIAWKLPARVDAVVVVVLPIKSQTSSRATRCHCNLGWLFVVFCFSGLSNVAVRYNYS